MGACVAAIYNRPGHSARDHAMTNRATADLCDAHGDAVQVCEPVFHSFGGRVSFAGPVSTVRCFEDNSRVKEAVEGPGEGRVLVVDGGGAGRHALLGGNLGVAAVNNGSAGAIIHGCIRSHKRGEGERDVPVRFAGVTFRAGDWVYADEDGIIVSHGPLP